MKLNYIYNTIGEVEYVVIPLDIWNMVKGYAKKFETKIAVPKQEKFQASKFRGMLKHHNFDIEEELKNMKSQWKKNI